MFFSSCKWKWMKLKTQLEAWIWNFICHIICWQWSTRTRVDGWMEIQLREGCICLYEALHKCRRIGWENASLMQPLEIEVFKCYSRLKPTNIITAANIRYHPPMNMNFRKTQEGCFIKKTIMSTNSAWRRLRTFSLKASGVIVNLK